ncbi:MAG: hypothetical protein UT66_C0022G0010 [candidate division CPR2 bacterium GW2011_GWC1_39_9]|uniref:Cytochrome oxidase complex assembly protein 1 n=1 Tax=candidate division CPR2 bacterium GW2011_GWC2_39_10 TaxID=1618345 RepID=A0A0G0LUZ6_UNCC2|nr:MAG: hypothetical protein UT18_C0007G0108 [candidate division CPR2 bacterium GW2011_GWC2_39_10]KKR34517.1 MAG: hypothetical protein UT66_C0022G0010 [candidate division CPR2 bacterium GW2011_GWC1_39_9]
MSKESKGGSFNYYFDPTVGWIIAAFGICTCVIIVAFVLSSPSRIAIDEESHQTIKRVIGKDMAEEKGDLKINWIAIPYKVQTKQGDKIIAYTIYGYPNKLFVIKSQDNHHLGNGKEIILHSGKLFEDSIDTLYVEIKETEKVLGTAK